MVHVCNNSKILNYNFWTFAWGTDRKLATCNSSFLCTQKIFFKHLIFIGQEQKVCVAFCTKQIKVFFKVKYKYPLKQFLTLHKNVSLKEKKTKSNLLD